MDELNELMIETHAHYQRKADLLHQETQQLKKANSKLKNEVRALKRIIHKLKQEKNKQHYRNGKRGARYGNKN